MQKRSMTAHYPNVWNVWKAGKKILIAPVKSNYDGILPHTLSCSPKDIRMGELVCQAGLSITVILMSLFPSQLIQAESGKYTHKKRGNEN